DQAQLLEAVAAVAGIEQAEVFDGNGHLLLPAEEGAEAEEFLVAASPVDPGVAAEPLTFVPGLPQAVGAVVLETVWPAGAFVLVGPRLRRGLIGLGLILRGLVGAKPGDQGECQAKEKRYAVLHRNAPSAGPAPVQAGAHVRRGAAGGGPRWRGANLDLGEERG